MSLAFSTFQYRKRPSVTQLDAKRADFDKDAQPHRNFMKYESSGDTKEVCKNGQSQVKRKRVVFVSDSDSDEPEVVPQKFLKSTCQSKAHVHNGITEIANNSHDEVNACRKSSSSFKLHGDVDEDAGVSVIDHEASSDEDEKTMLENVRVLSFMNSASIEELLRLEGVSKGKAKKLIALQPFSNWADLVAKVESTKGLSGDILHSCSEFLGGQEKINDLLASCESLALEIHSKIKTIEQLDTAIELPVLQPRCSSKSLRLKHYQLVGLNWLAMLHERRLNGILADQMGLGKTVQALAFLGHLIETGFLGPHLIVCPCSTVENWIRELTAWLPDAEYLLYSGTQDERYHLRRDVLEGLIEPNVIIASSTTVSSTKEDRAFFSKKLNIQYLVLDEAHILKNSKTARYKNLIRIQTQGKLLLTGTPLQNDLSELLSLLTFLLPDVMENQCEQIKTLVKQYQSSSLSSHEREYIDKVKKILRPFVLRRLKTEVLSDLPKKEEKILYCDMTPLQWDLYGSLISASPEDEEDSPASTNNVGRLMNLRKAANHPLLLRTHYTSDKILTMAKQYCKCPDYFDCDVSTVVQDMSAMSDFELHKLCKRELYVKEHRLAAEVLCDCGKMRLLDDLLPKLKQQKARVLLFSQFVIMLDVLEEYLRLRSHRYIRFDGSTRGDERQSLVDEFNSTDDIFIFLLSTKAGGLGINLTSANVVIFHDIDFNPYNDKQAEDRCHRLGQTRDVTIYKLISKDTIEEGMLKCGERKLRLEKQVVGSENLAEHVVNFDDDSSEVASLLKEEERKYRTG